MKEDDQQPKTQPAGNRPPPRPPRGTAVGLGPDGEGPDGDDSHKKGRATITKVAIGEGRFIRQSGGKGQYGHVIVKIEPNGLGKGIEIISDAPRSAIPTKFIKPVTDAVREALGAVGVDDNRNWRFCFPIHRDSHRELAAQLFTLGRDTRHAQSDSYYSLRDSRAWHWRSRFA